MTEYNQRTGEHEEEIIRVGGPAIGKPRNVLRNDYMKWYESLDDEGKFQALENERNYQEMLAKNLNY